MKVVLSGPIKGVSKSHALWVEDGTTNTPIVFFRKPKWVSNDDAWVKFIRGVSMAISAEGQAALNEMLESAVLDREASNDYRYVKGAFQTTITAIAIHRNGDSPIFGESTTIVRLDDEGGGPFIVIEQADASQSGAIRLDPDECEIVMREVGRLLEQKAIERKPEV